MKILIDIGHPAHVHYFKNFISKMSQKGHYFCVIARDKEITHQLLDAYQIQFIGRGKGKKGLLGKALYALHANWIIFKSSREFGAELFLSFGSPYAAQTAWLQRKPHIGITDTEHAKLGILAFAPFSKFILTPSCYKGSFGAKHLRFNAYAEHFYLHKNYFSASSNISQQLGMVSDDSFVVLRFISWNASHDIGQSGMSLDLKRRIVALAIEKGKKVFISAESDLPLEFTKFRLKISPEKMHHVLAAASLFVGESGTMATESAILGTPSVYVNSLNAGVFEEEVEMGVLYSFRTEMGVFEKVCELLQDPESGKKHHKKALMLNAKKEDPTLFLENFIKVNFLLKN